MKGLTYFHRDALSINEGEFPNIHIRWRRPVGFYLAICRKLRFGWFK